MFDLQRFLDAQAGGVYEDALAELQRGHKTSHWMWFVFPQLRGLGHSAASSYYGLSGMDEARAYLEHPVLGERLRHCCEILLSLDGLTAHQIFGHPDDLKLRSSMTLFELAGVDKEIFVRVLEKYFGGVRDTATIELLEAS